MQKQVIDLIVEKCIEYDDNKTDNTTDNKTDNKTKIVTKTVKNNCNVLTLISIVISNVYTIYFVYYNCFLFKNKDIFTKYNTCKETIIW